MMANAPRIPSDEAKVRLSERGRALFERSRSLSTAGQSNAQDEGV